MQSYDAASNATYLDGGAPFFARGTRETALLLLHGFSGCPYEMRWLGDRLAQQGYSVSAPALPGHATYPAALNGVRFEEWTASVAAAVRHLRAEVSPRVVVIGHSMGASSAVESIFAMQGMLNSILLPTINYSPDPEITLDCVPEGARRVDQEYVLKNSFGFGGFNACIVLHRLA